MALRPSVFHLTALAGNLESGCILIIRLGSDDLVVLVARRTGPSNPPAISTPHDAALLLALLSLRYRRKLWMREKGDVPFWG